MAPRCASVTRSWSLPLNRGLATSLLGARCRCPEGDCATSHERQRELLGGCPDLSLCDPHCVLSPCFSCRSPHRPVGTWSCLRGLTWVSHVASHSVGGGGVQRYRPLKPVLCLLVNL